MRYVTVGPFEESGHAATIKQFLKSRGYTEHQIRHVKYIENGLLKNGQPCRAVDLLQRGDHVQILVEDTRMPEVPWPVLYEDEDVLVMDKPAGLVIHPAHGHYEDSLVSKLSVDGSGIRVIGRLDQDTSGVLMLAKNAIAAERLQKQRWDGRLTRTYAAWVHGIPEPYCGTIQKPIGKAAKDANRMTTDPVQCVDNMLKTAVTHYKVVDIKDDIAKVELTIETGRTHQIRVHMASIGHPLVGDPIYGQGAEHGMTRTALHAWKLQWEQPQSGAVITVEAAIPQDLQSLVL